MKIAITCAFYPALGGIETVADLLAHEFVAAGHTVEIVASNSPGASVREFPFAVHYRPPALKRVGIYRRSDCILQFNLGLRALWPNLFTLRPVVISRQGIYDPADPASTMSDGLKHWLGGLFPTIACSAAVARSLRRKPVVIPNCYDPMVFRPADVPPVRDIVCVGRLIRDKGVDLLLEAVRQLKGMGLAPRVTVVGAGPERETLERQVTDAGITEQVEFAGAADRTQVAQHFRRHRIAVVPSRYHEAFGIVALEAMASGCHVIAADRGGLPEALGRHGRTFTASNLSTLVSVLAETLQKGPISVDMFLGRQTHLENHSPRHVAQRYIDFMQDARGKI